MIIDAVNGTNPFGTVWTPNLLSGNGVSPMVIGAAIGLAGLAILSKLPDLVPKAIFMIKENDFGKAIGEGLGSISPMAMATGAAEKAKVYNSLTGREIKDDVINYKNKLFELINRKNVPVSQDNPEVATSSGPQVDNLRKG